MLTVFQADQFTPTEWATAADKAKFANHFVQFVRSGFKKILFPKWFYRRLSTTFGHIAHYDINGFYDAQCSTTARRLAFLQWSVKAGGVGDPAYTYSDVERALAAWIRQDGILARYTQAVHEDIETRERAELARLSLKYAK